MATQEEKIKKIEDELKSLNKSLCQYGDYFNKDGHIDSEEQKQLNSMQSIIKKAEVKLAALKKAALKKAARKKAQRIAKMKAQKIAKIEAQRVAEMEAQKVAEMEAQRVAEENDSNTVKGPKLEMSSEDKEYGKDGEPDKTKSSTNVSISSDEIGISHKEGDEGVGMKVTKDSIELSADKDKEGATLKITKDEVELGLKKEVADGVEVSATFSNKKVTAGITKKWELKKKSKSFPFAAGPVPCYIEFGISGEFSLTAEGEANFETGISKIGVKADGKATGTIGIGANAGIVKLGGELDIIPSIKASGYLCYDSKKNKFYPDLSGINGDLSVKGRIVLKAGDEVMNLAKEAGIAEETLTFVLVESPSYSLLTIKSTGYDANGLKGEWKVSKGKDLVALEKKIIEYYNIIAGKYEEFKKLVEPAVEVVTESKEFWEEKGIIGGLSEAAKETSDYIRDKLD
jgi:hypothetical protein